MTITELDRRRYPIGKFTYPGLADTGARARQIELIRTVPGQLEYLLKGRPEADHDLIYRQGSWNIRQVVHHLADANIHAYVRLRMGLTQSQPRVMAWEESAWAGLEDALQAPLEASLLILKGLHCRWATFLEAVDEPDWMRRLDHPDYDSPIHLDYFLAWTVWHNRHHLGHVRLALGKTPSGPHT